MSHFIFCDQMLFEPLNSSHLDQSDNLSRLPDVAEVLEGDEGEGDVEGEEGEEVDQVHRLDEEPRLDRTAQQPVRKKLQSVHKKIELQPEAVFYREDNHRCFVNDVNYPQNVFVFNNFLKILIHSEFW